jgi:hypothetical protein
VMCSKMAWQTKWNNIGLLGGVSSNEWRLGGRGAGADDETLVTGEKSS